MKKRTTTATVILATGALTAVGLAPVSAAPFPASCANPPVRAECTYPFTFPAAIPATPTSDGSLPFLGWEHPGVNADSAKGYRSPDGAYDIYLNRLYDGPGTYTATVYKRGGYLLVDEGGVKASGAKTTYAVESKLRLQPAEPGVDDQPGSSNDEPVFPPAVGGTYKVSSITDMKDGTTRFRLAFTPDEGTILAPTGTWDRVVDGKPVWLIYAQRNNTVGAHITNSTDVRD